MGSPCSMGAAQRGQALRRRAVR
eukprot:COSAG04_NODE_2580_length_3898_cov_2.598315_8_plen_22_part_01